MNDVLVNKIQSIHRCIDRAREEYELAGQAFKTDYSRQDAAILNITRACEQAIDLASHLIRARKLGIPNDSKEGFRLLEKHGLISPELSGKLQKMVSFRNTVVHEYQATNIDIVIAVIQTGLADLVEFTDTVLASTQS